MNTLEIFRHYIRIVKILSNIISVSKSSKILICNRSALASIAFELSFPCQNSPKVAISASKVQHIEFNERSRQDHRELDYFGTLRVCLPG